MKARLFLATLLCQWLTGAAADPDLSRAQQHGLLRVFPDHLDAGLYYYLRTGVQLAESAGTPLFRFDINRYIGTSKTGDSDAFVVRALLRFTTEVHAEMNLAELREILQQNTRTPVRLEAAPVLSVHHALNYAGVDDDVTQALSLSPAQVKTEQTAQKSTGFTQITLAPQAHDAELLWNAFASGQTLMSWHSEWTVPGVRRQDDGWQGGETIVAHDMPITLSSVTHPDLFSKNELWQRLKIAHSELMVLCYDFINQPDSGLYQVTVDLRFTTLRDQVYTESVRFRADTDVYEQTVQFKHAADLTAGFEYRVRRLHLDGRREDSDWQHSDQAILDLTQPLISQESQPMESSP